MSELQDFLNGGGTLAPQINANTESIKKLSNKNYIVNGDFRINQYGADAVTSITSAVHYLDMWRHGYSGVTAINIDRLSGDYPSGFYSALKTTFTTAYASPASSAIAALVHTIEGITARELVNEEFTLSFWVKSSVAGINSISFQPTSLLNSYVVDYTVNQANTWEYKKITVSGGVLAGSVSPTVHLKVIFSMMAGSSNKTSTTNQWISGYYSASNNQVNNCATAGNTFHITGVRLERGSQATTEMEPYELELEKCKRRYQVHTGLRNSTKFNTTFNYIGGSWILPVEMRAAPVVTYSANSQVNKVDTSDSGLLSITAGTIGATSTKIVVDATLSTSTNNNWFLFDIKLDANI